MSVPPGALAETSPLLSTLIWFSPSWPKPAIVWSAPTVGSAVIPLLSSLTMAVVESRTSVPVPPSAVSSRRVSRLEEPLPSPRVTVPLLVSAVVTPSRALARTARSASLVTEVVSTVPEAVKAPGPVRVPPVIAAPFSRATAPAACASMTPLVLS